MRKHGSVPRVQYTDTECVRAHPIRRTKTLFLISQLILLNSHQSNCSQRSSSKQNKFVHHIYFSFLTRHRYRRSRAQQSNIPKSSRCHKCFLCESNDCTVVFSLFLVFFTNLSLNGPVKNIKPFDTIRFVLWIEWRQR